MRTGRFLVLLGLLSLWVTACRPAAKPPNPDAGLTKVAVVQATKAVPTSHIVEFKDRTIDLDAHLQGFPYSSPEVDLRSGRLFYKKTGTQERLMMLAFDPASRQRVDLSTGQVISPRDFSKRVFWGALWNPVAQKPLILTDQSNDEVTGLYQMDPATQTEKKTTSDQVGYIYGHSLNDAGDQIALVTRPGKDERDFSDLRVLDLKTGQEHVVYHDTPVVRMRWGAPSWNLQGNGLIVTFMAQGLRDRNNLVYVPLRGGQPKTLTDTATKRNRMKPLSDWIDNDQYLFTSDESGVTSVYRGSLKNSKKILVSPVGENVKSTATLYDDKRKLHVAIVVGNPLKSTLKLIDASSGQTTFEREFDGWLGIEDTYQNKMSLTFSSLSNPFTLFEAHMLNGQVEIFERAGYPAQLLNEIVNCKVEKISFSTFDQPKVPGEKDGMLHAYLMTPKHPRTGAERRALVLSFYGGGNSYDTDFQVLCQAGYYVMSPAPRGSTNFGTTFFTLGHGDWGGGETLDALWAGKWLAQHLSLRHDQIGIMGGSRGGYDTLRALTFPGQVRAQTSNGRDRDVTETFRFGFGISDFGISNILTAYDQGNISGWYVDLAGGNPHQNEKKWLDRSPITHADRLSGPLLLTHGDKDNRVPTEESRRMYTKLQELGKPVTYLELPGQGHGYKGVSAQTAYYRAVLKFLDSLL